MKKVLNFFIQLVKKREKKSYIFTEQIKEPVLEDNRGGFRETAGRKASLSNEEFDFLWKVVVSKAYDLNRYHERDWLNKVYFSNTLLFNEFGVSYGECLKKAELEDDDKFVKYIFSDILYNALKANTITKLCKRYGLPKNSLPKGILRSRSKERINQIISDDALVQQWDKYEKENLKLLKCRDVIDAVRQGKYQDLVKAIQYDFEAKRKYNVQKYNVLHVTDFDVIENGKNFGYQNMEQYKLLELYREHFKEIIFKSVEKSCLNRISNSKRYKKDLNENQKKILMKYLTRFLGEEKQIDFPVSEEENYDWLELVS